MEPHDLYQPVQPHKEVVPQEEIDSPANCLDLDPHNLEVLLAEVRDASGFERWIEDGTP
jgi:hypothetical protein